MPYASKRKANIGKELKQEASKCKKVTEFFTRKDNATTLCDTNVDKFVNTLKFLYINYGIMCLVG